MRERLGKWLEGVCAARLVAAGYAADMDQAYYLVDRLTGPSPLRDAWRFLRRR